MRAAGPQQAVRWKRGSLAGRCTESPTNLRKRILERTADEPSKVWSSLGRLRTGRRAGESRLPIVGGHVAEQGTAREEESRSDKCDCIVNKERRSEEHTSELQSQFHLVCRLLLEKKK